VKLPIPDELRDELEHASTAMDEMNVKLDAVIVILGDIRDDIRKQAT
jgi:hypothetical protein